MEAVDELIKRYGLEEDLEHVIIPLRDSNGQLSHCYLLKRRFIRLECPEGHFVDYPLTAVIEAIIRYPELLLSEALYQLQGELDIHLPEISDDEKETH